MQEKSTWSDIQSLIWLALSQEKKESFLVDKETFAFFSALPSPKKTILPQENIEEKAPLIQTSDLDQFTEPLSHIRLKKLLPHPSSTTPIDIKTTKQSLEKQGLPLSPKNLYPEKLVQHKPKPWALFLSVNTVDHETFVMTVLNAITSRLKVPVLLYKCSQTTLSFQLPLTIQECEHLLFFVDQHLESSLITSLETIQSFSKTQNSSPLPFSTLGTIHNKPLHSTVLHIDSHTNPLFKKQLWTALQKLVLQK